MIEWKAIPEYKGLYEASSDGQIRTVIGKTTSSARSKKRVWKQRVLKQKPKKYKNRIDMMVTLWKDGKPHYHLVSRLVATAFCGDNLESDLTVNHKDGNPLNNSADNLEWVTRTENIRYGYRNGQFSSICKSIKLYDKNGNIVKECRSTVEVDRWLERYRGYTSKSILAGHTTLTSKNGDVYSTVPAPF